MTKFFLDTNIVVDLLERREPFCHDAVRLFTMASQFKDFEYAMQYYTVPCTCPRVTFKQDNILKTRIWELYLHQLLRGRRGRCRNYTKR